MASERDREIWDDATNAVCQAMQEQKMCNCPDGDCLAAKIDFSPEKIATATRHAPAATDTGLVTKGFLFQTLTERNGWTLTYSTSDPALGGLPYRAIEPVCLRSQADELLAAKDFTISELNRLIDGLNEANAAQAAQIKELNANTDTLMAECHRVSKESGDQFREMRGQTEALKAKLAAAEKALTEIASFTQTTDLLWWQERARAVLGWKP